MSVESDPIPPVPEHTPPLREDESTRASGKFFTQTWTRWFVSIRDKLNVINESFINLIDVTGAGILVKSGVTWVTRTIVGVSNRTNITDGDGVSGNPVIDVVTADLVAGTGVSFTGSGVGKLIDNGTGNLTIDVAGAGGAINPAIEWIDYDDLITYNGGTGFATVTTAGGTVTFTGGTAGHPGVVVSSSLAVAATSVGILKQPTPGTSAGGLQIVMGGGVITFTCLVEIPTLLAGANQGTVRIGFMDEITGAPTNAVEAHYDNTNANWALWNRASGVPTAVTGGTAVTTGWTLIQIVVNATGTSAELFINGVSQGSAGGLPTLGVSYGAQIQKTASTTPLVLNTDFFHVRQEFTTPRY